MFSRMFYASCLAGVLCGLLLTAMQAASVVPIIAEAETYETSAPAPASDGHDHGKTWAPEDGIERTLWTSVSNVATAIGFSLLIVVVLVLRARDSLREGLLWGSVGFAVFFAAPSLGLLPEIPGTFAADLQDRQVWWLGTALATAVGLGLLIVMRPAGFKVAGAIVLAVPHLIGAPHPEVAGGNAPQELAEQFIIASTITNALFWVVLGMLSAWSYVLLGRLSTQEAAG